MEVINIAKPILEAFVSTADPASVRMQMLVCRLTYEHSLGGSSAPATGSHLKSYSNSRIVTGALYHLNSRFQFIKIIYLNFQKFENSSPIADDTDW